MKVIRILTCRVWRGRGCVRAAAYSWCPSCPPAGPATPPARPRARPAAGPGFDRPGASLRSRARDTGRTRKNVNKTRQREDRNETQERDLKRGHKLERKYQITNKQCCGSGSVCVWASRIRIYHYLYGYRSGSFHHKTKIVRKLCFYCFVTSLWLFIFEEWCNCTFKK